MKYVKQFINMQRIKFIQHTSYNLIGVIFLLGINSAAQPNKSTLKKKLQSQTSLTTEDGPATFSADRLIKHVTILASDSFMGRKPFTAGETMTIHYLQQQMAAAGLEPGNGNSYFQEVPLVDVLTIAAPTMEVQSTKGDFLLKDYDDFLIRANRTDGQLNIENADVVFAGYGVVAPEYNWNDYQGIDVKGKVVIVMINDPGSWIGDTTLFRGKKATFYARARYKYEEAARQGARACLVIHNRAAGSSFSATQRSWSTTTLQSDSRGSTIKTCEVIGSLAESAGRKLLAAASYDSSLFAKANQQGFSAVPLNLKLTMRMKVQATFGKSYNVVGKITGTKYPDEVIIYSAHWDHLGIGKPDKTGDSIYNGAYDNASGTAGLLEMGRAFAKLKIKPERTVLFLAVTAEETLGLLGSAYYVQRPIYSINKTVANINMDGLYPFAKTKDFTILGQGQSTLEDLFEEEVKKTGGYISPELHPEAGLFYRSDHFNFARVGIPAIFAGCGNDVIGKGKEYGQQLRDQHTTQKIHQPSDEYDPATWTMEGAVEYLKLIFRVGKRLGFEKYWPQWKQGSPFKSIRENNK